MNQNTFQCSFPPHAQNTVIESQEKPCVEFTHSVVSDCNPMDCSPPGSSVHGDSPGKNTGVGCHALPQGNFPTRGSNRGLLHCRRILYQLSYQESFRKNLLHINVLFWKLGTMGNTEKSLIHNNYGNISDWHEKFPLPWQQL